MFKCAHVLVGPSLSFGVTGLIRKKAVLSVWSPWLSLVVACCFDILASLPAVPGSDSFSLTLVATHRLCREAAD